MILEPVETFDSHSGKHMETKYIHYRFGES